MSFRTIASPATGKSTLRDELSDLVIPQLRIHGCGFSHQIDDWSSGGDIMSPFWCLWHTRSEGSWIESGGTRWELGPEKIMLKPPQIVYSRHSRHPISQLWLHFSLEPDYAVESSEPCIIPVSSLFREQITALTKAYDKAHGDGVRALYHHAAALLNSCFAVHPLPLRVLPDALRAVLQRIDTAPAADLSNATLARLANMSVSSFINLFKRHMHQPPATYVRDVRYQKASRMLTFSDLSIEQIAAATGYPNRHYFSRDFANRTGCGPATFRKQHHSR